jgi:hypothetical protein
LYCCQIETNFLNEVIWVFETNNISHLFADMPITIKKILSPNTCEWLINTAIKNDTKLFHDQSYICMMENKEMREMKSI